MHVADERAGADASPATFESLIEDHGAAITRLVGRLTGWSADREDLVQEVFLKALSGLARFRGESSQRTWLTRIAINECRKFSRRRMLARGWWEWLRRQPVRETPSASVMADVADSAEQVRRAINRLRQADREVLILHYLEEHSIANVAEMLRLSRNAVEVRLTRARKRLKHELEFQPDDSR